MNDIVVEFNNFGFQYNAQSKPTLYDINLTVRRGEKVLIAGPSGCGKSTLAHCINGLIPFSFAGEMTGSAAVSEHLPISDMSCMLTIRFMLTPS